MSQDGRGQLIPKDINEGDAGPPGFDCEHDGWVYARRSVGFAKCSKGVVHCLRCHKPARRFRRGWVCSDKSNCKGV